MKNLIALFSFCLMLSVSFELSAQRVYFPPTVTNASDMTLTHIDRNAYSTVVNLIYTPTVNSEMFINSMMYIENAKQYGGKKLILKKFYCNGSEHYKDYLYTVNAGETYYLEFEFGKLPFSFKTINLKEPATTNERYEPWHWKNINLNYDLLKNIKSIILYGTESELTEALRSLELIALYVPADQKLKSSIAGVKIVLISEYGYSFK